MHRSLLAASALLLAASFAAAQPMPGGGAAIQRPSFSPYLNLLNTGGNPGLNYLGIVRPQMQLQQQFGQLQQQTNQQLLSLGQAYDNQNAALTGAFLPATGYVARFNSAPGYFGRIPYGNGIYSGGYGGGLGGGFGGGGMNRFGGGVGGLGGGSGAGAMGAMQRPSFSGGGVGGAGGIRR